MSHSACWQLREKRMPSFPHKQQKKNNTDLCSHCLPQQSISKSKSAINHKDKTNRLTYVASMSWICRLIRDDRISCSESDDKLTQSRCYWGLAESRLSLESTIDTSGWITPWSGAVLALALRGHRVAFQWRRHILEPHNPVHAQTTRNNKFSRCYDH